MIRLTCGLLAAPLILAGCGADTTADEPEPDVATTDTPENATAYPAVPYAPPGDPTVLAVRGLAAAAPPYGGRRDDGSCIGAGQYIDFNDGVQITIRGASDNIVGITESEPGEWSDNPEACYWTFEAQVPAGEGFYQADIEGFGSSGILAEDEVSDGVPFIIEAQ